MNPRRLPIGEFARRCRLSVSALRFYDEAGVLRPAFVEPATGYRQYSPDQVAPGRLLRELRAAGMPLAAIRHALGEPGAARRLIAAHAAEMERLAGDRRRALEAAAGLIEDMEVTAMSECMIGAAALAQALAQVQPAAASDAEAARRERPVLAGILLELREDCLRLAATDGHRLAVRDLVPETASGAPCRVVAQAAGLAAAVGRLVGAGPVRVALEPGQLDVADTAVGTLPDDYPDYRLILEGVPRTHRVALESAPLREALERSGEEVVRMRLDAGRLRLGEREVPADYSGAGLTVGFNRSYLLTAIDSAGAPDLVLEIAHDTGPALIRSADDGSFSCVVMPVRLVS